MNWQAYIHTNGKLQVKRYEPRIMMEIDIYSPFVLTYLGVTTANDRDEAVSYFESKMKQENL